MSNNQESLSIGLDITFGGFVDIKQDIETALNLGFNFVASCLVNPRFKRYYGSNEIRVPVTRSDMLLCSSDWSRLVVPKLSPWINADSYQYLTRRASELAFDEELSYASHLVTPIAMIVCIKSMQLTNMARIIYAHITSPMKKAIWVIVPLTSAKMRLDDVFNNLENDESFDDNDDPWKWWNKLHLICNLHKKLIPVIELTSDLPSEDIIKKWLGEPVKAIIINTKLFITNKKGFPILPWNHQQLVKKFFNLDVQILLTGRNRHGVKGLTSYRLYLNHLYQSRDPADIITKFSKGYEDFLQIPLQPLMDNLDSGTYEVFEKDPIKYTAYQEAIFNALIQKFGPMGENCGHIPVLMVLGAGRGPLVNCALRAASAAGKKIKVYAIEKNKNAIITLENMKRELWKNEVIVVSVDMRYWEPPELADIIVSELLGSFGDNELSPECLDGAQRFLKADAISIPCKYTSYLAPIQSCKLWNDAKGTYKDPGNVMESNLETPYVVHMLNNFIIDEPKPVFTFKHPNKNKEENLNNDRFATLTFKASQDCVLHGFAGYFDCVLFGDKVNLSILPDKHSIGMISWFPVYFPIHSPIQINSGDSIEVNFWRLSNTKNVWYEWLVTKPSTSSIHNINGRSYNIGL